MVSRSEVRSVQWYVCLEVAKSVEKYLEARSEVSRGM